MSWPARRRDRAREARWQRAPSARSCTLIVMKSRSLRWAHLTAGDLLGIGWASCCRLSVLSRLVAARGPATLPCLVAFFAEPPAPGASLAESGPYIGRLPWRAWARSGCCGVCTWHVVLPYGRRRTRSDADPTPSLPVLPADRVYVSSVGRPNKLCTGTKFSTY